MNTGAILLGAGTIALVGLYLAKRYHSRFFGYIFIIAFTIFFMIILNLLGITN